MTRASAGEPWPQGVYMNVCLCEHVFVTLAHLCVLLRAPFCFCPLILTHILSGQHREHSGPGEERVSISLCVCVYECQYMKEWVLGGQLHTYTHTQTKNIHSFSWSHQWIVNTVLTMAGQPLATTYWIRYVTSDMASIWNPFVMQYSGVLDARVRTQSWVTERS